MHFQRPRRDHRTALIVADDAGMLSIVNRVLGGSGFRVLMAMGVDAAVQLLQNEIWIDTVLIHDGLTDSDRIELLCRRREIEVLSFRGMYEDGIIRLRLPEARLGSQVPYAPRILVVEDEPDVRSICERIFTEDGYLVTCVSTGHEAMEMALKVALDAIVVDVSLPDMDGHEVIRQIRSEFPWVRALAVGDPMTAVSGQPSMADELRMAVYRLLDPAERWKQIEPVRCKASSGAAGMTLSAAS